MLHYLLSFKGRINRAKYILWAALVFAVQYAFKYIGWDPAAVLGDTPWTAYFKTEGAYSQAEIVAYLLLAWPTLAIAVKRLHDRNKGAIWIVLYWIVPPLLTGMGRVYAGVSAPVVAGSTPAFISLVCWVTAGIITLIAVVDLAFTAGVEGDNRYGADPLMPPEPKSCVSATSVEGCISRPEA